MNPLKAYLKQLRDIRATGANVAETSFYHALSNPDIESGPVLGGQVSKGPCAFRLATRKNIGDRLLSAVRRGGLSVPLAGKSKSGFGVFRVGPIRWFFSPTKLLDWRRW